MVRSVRLRVSSWLLCIGVSIGACDWYGASTSRKIGDALAVGSWSVEVRTSMGNQGIIKKNSGDTWAVTSDLAYRDGEELRPPIGTHRGLCAKFWKAPPMDKAAARSAAGAHYERDPVVFSCADETQGARVVQTQCPDEPRGDVWLVLWPTDSGVAYGNNVNAADCDTALGLALEQRNPSRP